MSSEKKNIYSLNLEEFRKLLKEFGHTLYGRTIFFVAYFIPGILFLTSIILTVCEFIIASDIITNALLITLASFVLTFVVGNMYYYKELRIFADKK